MRLQVLLSSVFLTMLALPATGFTQEIVRCNSDDMRRHYCEVGPNREIRFARQVSESRCVQGSTFGIERNRIWVDRGCRADFQVYRENSGGPGNSDWGRSHNPNQDRDRDNDWRRDNDGDRGRAWGGGSGRTVSMSCNSNDEGYHSCAAQGEILRARMTNQHSGSPCTEGRSWGYRGSTLWVDHGCRADFELTLRDQGGFGGGGGSRARGRTYNMRCSSDDFGYHTCSAEGEVIRARMIHQISGSACTDGRTWGYRREGIWVDKGCRAEFEVTTR